MDRIRQLFHVVISVISVIKARGKPTDEENASQTENPVRRESQQVLVPGHVPQAGDDTAPIISEHLHVFRQLVGITHDASMSATQSVSTFRTGKRPAPNVGIYARVVSSEQKAKSGYKNYSAAINGALGGQIVVASSLTAMGAAGTSHGAITAFGAMNTIVSYPASLARHHLRGSLVKAPTTTPKERKKVTRLYVLWWMIAGFLTYLKGSGLPSRLKYYADEWKKLREYIEQRERDLSLPTGASLDVYAILEIIERMYEETKADIEVNTPDGYFSINNVRGGRMSSKTPHVHRHQHPASRVGSEPMTEEPSVDLQRPSSAGSKSRGLETSLPENQHDADHERRQDNMRDPEKAQQQTLSSRLGASIDRESIDQVRDHRTREPNS